MIARLFPKVINFVYMLIFSRIALVRRLGVIIGHDCRVMISKWGTETFLIRIGSRVTITAGVKFLTHDGSAWLVRNEHNKRYQKYAPITIEDNVFIGVNSIIMLGVTIGSKVIIGAGSVVTKSVLNSSVYAGNPAKFICTFDDYEQKIKRGFPNDEDIIQLESYRKTVENILKRNS